MALDYTNAKESPLLQRWDEFGTALCAVDCDPVTVVVSREDINELEIKLHRGASSF